jgi:hypothetical protein
MTGLGTFGLDPVGAAINNHGVIVGQSSLNATAINDNGRIAASGFSARGQEHAFLLNELVSAPRTYRPSA